ncbi:UNVERIFIED_CONTAM: hypothetical protein RMT77_010565 [Armadillidium vulgare]
MNNVLKFVITATMLLSVAVILVYANSVFGACFYDTVLAPGQTLNFDSPKDGGRHCMWVFRCPDADSISVKCPTFSIPDKSNCFFNYLLLSDGSDSQRFCGISFQMQTFESNYIVALFQSSIFFKTQKHFFYPSRPDRKISCQVTCNASLNSTTETPPVNVSSSSPSTGTSTKCSCGRREPENRIVNGSEASLHEYPWQVVLRDKSSHRQYCGGTLICNKYVLTASHCVDGESSNEIVVSLGDHNKIQNSETEKTVHRNIVKIIMHENYNKQTVDNDIALLQLDQPIEFNKAISPVCLPFGLKDTSISGKIGVVTGWGAIILGGQSSEVLNELITTLMTTEECRSGSKYGNSITNNMICAYNDGKGDSCQGDSGGPLTMVDEEGRVNLVGVVSWGNGCSLVGYPGVYTKVTNYLNWVKEKVSCDLCGSS